MKILRPYQIEAIDECWQALKANSEPVLLMASVGAGKSLMLAEILLSIQTAGKRALSLVNNAELVRNNYQTFRYNGGDASIYCASLNEKETTGSVIFGTPQTIINGINKSEDISRIKFNLIVVDEAHAINYLNHKSCFMRILRFYKEIYPEMRLLGATGTNFRFKGNSIVGKDCLFKTQVGNITTSDLIKNDYLVKPYFEIDEDLVIDFSKVKIKQNGLFDQRQLQETVSQNTRLTEIICKQIVNIMESQNRFGVFIFATTKKHAYEIIGHLPERQSAIILGETNHDERARILQDARIGKIRYLVNIAIISVGVDVPAYDTVAYLRPTESLVLLVQTMGRALRLSPATNKKNALILDFAGNIERHRDWDDPILLEALKETIDKDKPLVILCPACNTMNTEYSRRCIGHINEARCSYLFEFKDCPNEKCRAQNDIVARHCRVCEHELIDPNAKLSLESIKKQSIEVHVVKAKYNIMGANNGFRLNCEYTCQDKNGNVGTVREQYIPSSEKACRFFYANFVRKHCEEPSKWYMHLDKRYKIVQMLQCIKTPSRLCIVLEKHGSKIKNRYFD